MTQNRNPYVSLEKNVFINYFILYLCLYLIGLQQKSRPPQDMYIATKKIDSQNRLLQN